MSTTFPMGYNGMQGTFRLSKMEYKLSAPFDSTMPSGYSTEYNFTLTRPLIEKLTKNLNATFLVSRNDYVNNLSTGNNSEEMGNENFDKFQTTEELPVSLNSFASPYRKMGITASTGRIAQD